MFKRNLLAAAALALVAGATFAQNATVPTTPATAVDEAHDSARNARQQQRIQAGEANGSVTPREQRRLEFQQRRIHRTEKRAEADGTVTQQEQAHITHMQDRADQTIYDQKHDKQGTVTSPKNK